MSVAEAFVHRYEPGSGPATLLLLHGTGGDEHQLIDLGRQLAPDAALLSRAGRCSRAASPRASSPGAAWAISTSTTCACAATRSAQWVADACVRYGRDPGRVIAVGYSNGANIAVELLFRHGGVLRGAALLRPMLPYRPGVPCRWPAPTS